MKYEGYESLLAFHEYVLRMMDLERELWMEIFNTGIDPRTGKVVVLPEHVVEIMGAPWLKQWVMANPSLTGRGYRLGWIYDRLPYNKNSPPATGKFLQEQKMGQQDGFFETADLPKLEKQPEPLAPQARIPWQFGHAMLGERRRKRGIDCSFCEERFYPEPRFLNPLRAMRQLQAIPLPCDICWDRLPGEEQRWFLEQIRMSFEGLEKKNLLRFVLFR